MLNGIFKKSRSKQNNKRKENKYRVKCPVCGYEFERNEGDSSSAVIRLVLKNNKYDKQLIEEKVEEFKEFQKNYLVKNIEKENVCYPETIQFLKELKEKKFQH